MSARNEFLCLEVWLGPMEGVRAVGDGPAAFTKGVPQTLRIAKLELDRREQVKNHLVLGACVGVSNDRHAVVRYSQGRIVLRDLGSRNGTFASGEQIPPEEDFFLNSGDVFLVSLTPVRVTLEDNPVFPSHPLQPVPIERFTSPELAPLLASCRQVAESRRERFIDTRHLSDGVLRNGGPAVEDVLAQAGLRPDLLLNQLWDPTFFPVTENWAAEALLRTLGLPGEMGEVFVASPKVCRMLAASRRPVEAAPGREKAQVLGAELFSALARDEAGPAGLWLRRLGLGPLPGTGTAVIEKSGKRPGAGASPPVSSPGEPLPSERSSPSKVFGVPRGQIISPGPPAGGPELPAGVIEAKAHRLAEEICGLSISEWFTSPQERKPLIKERITSALEAIPQSQRRAYLEKIYQYFPVVGEDAGAEAELQALRAEAEELERRVADLKAKQGNVAQKPLEAFPWGDLLGTSQKPPSDPQAVLARQAVRFSLDIELFMRELVHGTMNSIYQTGTILLPDQNTTLRALLDQTAQGRPAAVERVADYILAVKRWQEACMSAYSDAPSEWFGRLWKKVNPAVIEGFVKAGGFKSKEKEWWQEYKAQVRDLSPDVAQDQVLAIVADLARAMYEKLKSGS